MFITKNKFNKSFLCKKLTNFHFFYFLLLPFTVSEL
nr:MAG TPA: hypothetical protein [Caudoviricetes sp.]